MNENHPSGGADDQFRALMEGLRTTLPGVQVLFGFLLALPFTGDFGNIGRVDRFTYAVAFLSTAVSSVLLIAPSAHQRVRGLMTGIPRTHVEHIRVAVKLTVAGTVSFLVGIVASVHLVTSVQLGSRLAAASVAVVTGLAAWTWFYMPLVRFQRWPDDQRRSGV
jgi:hypothetical protein